MARKIGSLLGHVVTIMHQAATIVIVQLPIEPIAAGVVPDVSECQTCTSPEESMKAVIYIKRSSGKRLALVHIGLPVPKKPKFLPNVCRVSESS